MTFIAGPTSLYPSYDQSSEVPSIFNKYGDPRERRDLDDQLQSWIRAAVSEGQSFIKASRSYQNIELAINIICGELNQKISTTTTTNLSQLNVNNIKRDIKEMVAIMSNIRPSWIYTANSGKDELWLNQARILNGLNKDWYKRGFIDREFKKLLQLGTVEGTGYISPIYNQHLYGLYKGGIELRHFRYNKALPVQLGREFDPQRAYAWVLIDEIPLNRARFLFPHKAHQIRADRSQIEFASDHTTNSPATGFWEAIKSTAKGSNKQYSCPMVDVAYIYVDDRSLNPFNKPIPMGDASYKYVVPYKGMRLANGRDADYEDCFLYPNKRLIIATRGCILYDGPSFWWHGKFPIVKYSPDEWVFSYLGFSLATECLSLNQSYNKMSRDIEDALRLKIDPPLAVDEVMMSKTQSESKTLRRPGNRIRGKLSMGEFIKGILPPEAYNVQADHFLFVEKIESKIKDILGLPDLQNLQKARQIPSSDSIEKFFAEAGSIVTDMSRSLDPIMWQIADMNRYYFFQFYNFERRIKILGKDGITEEDFDFAPGTLVPKPDSSDQSGWLERAKRHVQNFSTDIEPTSLHEISSMSNRLLKLQAKKLSPFLVSDETLAKTLNIQNWGTSEGDTERAKVISEVKLQQNLGLQAQFDQMKLQLLGQVIAAQLMQQMNPQNQLVNMLGQAFNQVSGETVEGNGNVGRPPSFENEPKLASKDGGTRTTVTT